MLTHSDPSAYPESKYEDWLPGSESSARAIMPRIIEWVRPTSIIDVGCGVGAWMDVCRALGVPKVHGLDGPYVPRELLRSPEECFSWCDLHSEWPFFDRFSLAICLETAEHLDPSAADDFISRLVSLAPVIVFSAAIPFQGGDDHRNEQWPDYWSQRFVQHGYTPIDCLRHDIREDISIEWWYRQNIFLAASREAISANPALAKLAQQYGSPSRQVTWECYANRCEYLTRAVEQNRSFRSRIKSLLQPLGLDRRVR
jgi:hypothetical protein